MKWKWETVRAVWSLEYEEEKRSLVKSVYLVKNSEFIDLFEQDMCLIFCYVILIRMDYMNIQTWFKDNSYHISFWGQSESRCNDFHRVECSCMGIRKLVKSEIGSNRYGFEYGIDWVFSRCQVYLYFSCLIVRYSSSLLVNQWMLCLWVSWG